jgi:hypothetical protein
MALAATAAALNLTAGYKVSCRMAPTTSAPSPPEPIADGW